MRHFSIVAYISFSLSEFRTGWTSVSGFRFFAGTLRAALDFALERLPFCFLAVATDLFFFSRGMSETILPHENFWFAEMFLLRLVRKFASNNFYLFSTIQ
jgi:hypothetical protein